MEGMDSSVLVSQIAFLEGIGAVILTGVFGLVLKWYEGRRDRKRDIERQEDLRYRQEREEREARERKERAERDAARNEYEAAKLNLLFATANGCDVLLQSANDAADADKARDSIANAKSECNRIVNSQAVKSIGGAS